MNTTLPPTDDTRLHAWLDGELPAEERAAVDAWLQQHPEDAARVRLWAADRDALRQRLDAQLAEPLPEAWRRQLHTPAANDGRWARRAQFAGVVLVAALTGFGLGRSRPAAGPETLAAAPWVQRAAAAHVVYVPEKRHPVEVAVRAEDGAELQSQEQHLAAWLTKRLAFPVKLFDLRAQGFALVGGRLLPDAGQPGAQLMYEDAQGQRVTVYLRRPEQAAPIAFRYEQAGALGQFYWVEGAAGYALTGSLPKAQLLTLAEAIYQQGVGDNPAHGPR